MPIAVLVGSAPAIPLSDRRRESIVLGHGVQLLRTVSPMMTVRWGTTARVATSIRHTCMSGRSILIGGAVTGAFRPPLQKSAILRRMSRNFPTPILRNFQRLKY